MKIKDLRIKYSTLPERAKASFWFAVCIFLQKGISVITIPIFTRIMPADAYGEFNVFISWMSIVTVFCTLNIFAGIYLSGLIHFKEDMDAYTSSLECLVTMLTFVTGGIYFIFSAYFGGILDMPPVYIVLMLVIIWGSSVFSFWSSKQRVLLNYKALIIVTLLFSILAPGVGMFLMTFWKDQVLARIFGMAIVGGLIYTILFISDFNKGKTCFSLKYWKYAIFMALPLIPHYLSNTVLLTSDKIMISYQIGNCEAGIYGFGYSIGNAVMLFHVAIMQTVEPWIYQKIEEKDFKSLNKVAEFLFLIMATLITVFVAFIPEIVYVSAPEEYYEAIWCMGPIAMSVFFIFLYVFFVSFEFYYKTTLFIAISTCLGAILNIVLNYFFIRLYGYHIAGYTTLICYIIFAFAHYLFMCKICKINCKGDFPYNVKYILLLVNLFLLINFFFIFLYNFTVVRYLAIAVIFIPIVYRRKFVKDKVMMMIDLKQSMGHR